VYRVASHTEYITVFNVFRLLIYILETVMFAVQRKEDELKPGSCNPGSNE